MRRVGAFVVMCGVVWLASSGCWKAEQSFAGEQVERYGTDYARTKREALSSDKALRRLFLVGTLMDAAGSEQYSGDVREVLDAVGEERFVRVLKSVPVGVQAAVLEHVRYDAGVDRDAGATATAFAKRYPAVWELMNRAGSSEQSGRE